MNKNGRFGIYGGQYISETLMNALYELEKSFNEAMADPEFTAELDRLYREYANRPSLLYYAEKMTKDLGGARVYLKREDLNHTGAHKINNVLGQALRAKRMGKTRLIAETGAGQHGVATAIVCALMGFKCRVYMGARDMERLEERFLTYPTLAVEQTRLTINKMAELTRESMQDAIALLSDYSDKGLEQVRELEGIVDRYEDKIGSYLMKLTAREMTETQNKAVSQYLRAITDLERISDHALNIAESAKELFDKKLSFSPAGQHELAQRAAAQQHAGKADQQHTQRVPQAVHMGNRLAFKAEGEPGAFRSGGEDQVRDQRGDQDGRKTEQELELFKENRVPDAADHAQAGALSQTADNEAGQQADPDCRVFRAGAGAFFREEQEGGNGQEQDEQDHCDGGKRGAFRRRELIGALQRITPLQVKDAAEDAGGKAHQAEDRVEVSAGDPQDHAEGAAQEHQAADHGEEAEDQPREGGTAAPGRKLFLC